jgi:class 3 adenylate cyclase
MSEIDPRADTPLVDWGELTVSGLLPTGTVTLLLADVDGSTRLWETQPDQMTAAMARMNGTVMETIVSHDGVRPVEQGEGDSFVAAFARRLRRGRLRAGTTARTAGPNPAAHRHPHRRNPAPRRKQLRRHHRQPHRTATRPGT